MNSREIRNGNHIRINIDDGKLIVEGEVVVKTSLGITVQLHSKQKFIFFSWQEINNATEFVILKEEENQKES